MKQYIFISYSHHDRALVTPVVGLLRVSKARVFHDLDSIEPGRKWKEEIENALERAALVMIFWCTHSARSDEVRRELEFALELKKDILPVLLDRTPLIPALAEFQFIDFSGAAFHPPIYEPPLSSEKQQADRKEKKDQSLRRPVESPQLARPRARAAPPSRSASYDGMAGCLAEAAPLAGICLAAAILVLTVIYIDWKWLLLSILAVVFVYSIRWGWKRFSKPPLKYEDFWTVGGQSVGPSSPPAIPISQPPAVKLANRISEELERRLGG